MLIKQEVGEEKGDRGYERELKIENEGQEMDMVDNKRSSACVSFMATAMITVLVKCYLSFGSFSWGSVSG